MSSKIINNKNEIIKRFLLINVAVQANVYNCYLFKY